MITATVAIPRSSGARAGKSGDDRGLLWISAGKTDSNWDTSTSTILTCIAERDEPPPILVPKREAHAAKTLTKRESAEPLELRMIPQYARQAVVRDSTAQVVNVVHTDIGGEPAQNTR